MKVSAVIPTRGNVDMRPVVESLACFDEVLIWDNSVQQDLGVYGRYAMIEKARNDLVFTQDDDVIVSDPQEIVRTWVKVRQFALLEHGDDSKPYVVANMPDEFRHDGYTDSCLVGFGACFHRDLPARAFERFDAAPLEIQLAHALTEPIEDQGHVSATTPNMLADAHAARTRFYRTCDVVFTTLTPRVLVDVPKIDREFASDPDRMWRQPDHIGERVRMLGLARMVRDV